MPRLHSNSSATLVQVLFATNSLMGYYRKHELRHTCDLTTVYFPISLKPFQAKVSAYSKAILG